LPQRLPIEASFR